MTVNHFDNKIKETIAYRLRWTGLTISCSTTLKQKLHEHATYMAFIVNIYRNIYLFYINVLRRHSNQN